MSLVPEWERYNTPEKQLGYFENVAMKIRTVPGVKSVGYASTIPLSHPNPQRFYIREIPATGSEVPHIETYFVSSDYFRTMQTPLLQGRFIDSNDKRGMARVAVVSETCARTQFHGGDPIGQHVQVFNRDEHAPWATVVGVVADVHQYGLDKLPDAAVYFALVQADEPQGWGSLIVRCSRYSGQLTSAVTAAMRSVDREQPIFHVQPMDAYISKSLAQRTFVLSLIAVFGALALLLAAVGVYGVISYSVAMRTREVGIRMALGARSADVVFMILGQVFATALAGLAIGLAVSRFCSRFLAALLFGIGPHDGATIAGVAILISAVTLLASYLPAIRASKLPPIKALQT